MEFGWPVFWTEDAAWIYHADAINGNVTHDEWENTFLRAGNATRHDRHDGIAWAAPQWHAYMHFGKVPTKTEVFKAVGLDISPTKVETERDQQRKQGLIARKIPFTRYAMATRRHELPRAEVKSRLADTDRGYDLVSRKHVSKIADRINRSGNPLTFSSANGTTKADEDIFLRLDELDEDVEPHLLTSTPAVLSIGRRCLDRGYSFRWPAGKLPSFVTQRGAKVKLILEDYIPYLRSSHACNAACDVISLRTTTVKGNHHTQSAALPGQSIAEEGVPTVKVLTATGPVLAEEVLYGDDPAPPQAPYEADLIDHLRNYIAPFGRDLPSQDHFKTRDDFPPQVVPKMPTAKAIAAATSVVLADVEPTGTHLAHDLDDMIRDKAIGGITTTTELWSRALVFPANRVVASASTASETPASISYTGPHNCTTHALHVTTTTSTDSTKLRRTSQRTTC